MRSRVTSRTLIHGGAVAVNILLVLCVARAARARQLGQKPRARPIAAESVRPRVLHFTTHRLANGLEVVLLEEHGVPVINLQVWYHVGSKDEQPGKTGFAHLFEHLMYKGSAHVGAEEHSRIIEAVGGFDNAETEDDDTHFRETFPSNYLERVLWLEADRMGSLNVDQKNFESEREVVKEELRVRVENQPYGHIQEDLREAAFTVHGYHHTPIGSIADLDRATLADVRAFHDTYYKPNNATLVIVGDFDSAQAMAWVHEYFDGVPPSQGPIPHPSKPEPPQTAERVVHKSYSNTPLPAAVLGYKIPARFAPDAYPLDLAANILAGGESSRLYQTLVYKDRIAVEAAGFGNFLEAPSLFWAYAIMNQGYTAEQGQNALEDVLNGMKKSPPGEHEFQKAENQEIAAFVLGRETDQEKADALAEDAVIGKDPNLVNTELGRYLRVTPADLQRAAGKYFDAQRETVILVTPEAPKPPAAPAAPQNPGAKEQP